MRFHPKELALARETARAGLTSALKRILLSPISDGAGGQTDNEIEAPAAVPCRIAPLSGLEALIAGKVAGRTRYRVFTPHDFDADAGQRFKIDGVIYEVESAERPRSADEIERSYLVYRTESSGTNLEIAEIVINSAVARSVGGDGSGDKITIGVRQMPDCPTDEVTYECVVPGSPAQPGNVAVEISDPAPIHAGENIEGAIYLTQGPSGSGAVIPQSDAGGEPTTVSVTIQPGWEWVTIWTTGAPRITIVEP